MREVFVDDTNEHVTSVLSRRRALIGAVGVGAASLAAGAGAFAADNTTPAKGGLPLKPYKFSFVCHVTLDQFFTPTVYGIQDACAQVGATYQWTGSQKNVVSEMVS